MTKPLQNDGFAMAAKLFEPISLGPHRFANRIAVAPMAQYSAVDGAATDWHLIHWGGLASSGAGLVMIEATAVSADGRGTPGDLCLYDDSHEAALKRVVAAVCTQLPARFGIQLCHAGRKGSTDVHWLGGRPLPRANGGWRIVAPSAIGFGDWPAPEAMTVAEIAQLVADFAKAAARAARSGIEVIELHAAHGYLLHSFLSPLSNQRTDDYGGSLVNRMRLPLDVFDAVQKAAPDVTLGVRLTGSDWIEGGISPGEAIAFATALAERGCHYVDVSSGGLDPRQKISVGPGYQLDFAAAVKRAAGIPVRAVGLIVNARQAEDAIAGGKADLIAIGRSLLANPRWVWQAAAELGAAIELPPPYARAGQGVWPGWKLLAEGA
jgi:2,4-dienoyl-CoA reductase-like NADH-dependent reductase (Old Yellow Enzyme family)